MSELVSEEFLNGPDQIKPANNYMTWKADGVVKLRTNKDRLKDSDYVSIPTLIKTTAAKYQLKVALRYKKESVLQEVTYGEYEKTCRTVAKAFLKFGLRRHHAVCILGYNAPEWIYSALGAILAGGFQAGIYATSSAEACLHYINLSSADIVVVEDNVQLQKILAIKDRSKDLRAIIQYSGKPTAEGVYSWDDVIRIGENESEDGLESVLKTIAINEGCTIIYTSGTTSLPKAVMLNHDNILHGAKEAGKVIGFDENQENNRIMSFLPMNHIASQVVDIFLSWMYPCTIYIADKNCLKDTMVENLKICQPTAFFAVPRVWEKLKDKLTQDERNHNFFIQRRLLSLAKKVALTHYENLAERPNYESMLYKIFKFAVYNKVKRDIGLEQCKLGITGAAPTSIETKKYFFSLDIAVIEIYGLSETTGTSCASIKQDYASNHVGKIDPDRVHIKISNPNSEGLGEICLNGRGIFMGYLNDEKNTMETIEPDGWMHSGDAGIIDENDRLKLTGRIKEIIITAGGENIPAPLIEESVKSNLPVVSNAVLIGEKRKYLTVLLTLKSEIDPKTGIPSDELTKETKEWCKSLGCQRNTISEIIKEKPKEIYDAITDGITKANRMAISNAQKIQKFQILPRDFSLATEELSPTLKLKRSVIYEKYEHLINEMYA